MIRDQLQSYESNGEKCVPTFSPGEMSRRQGMMRNHLSEHEIDAALLTSYHNINYFGDFLYCQFGRRYGLVIDHTKATSISAGIDGGQPWRRTFGENITYTDWSKDNYFHAIRSLIKGVRRLGIEFDDVNVELMQLLQSEYDLLLKRMAEFYDAKKAVLVADQGGVLAMPDAVAPPFGRWTGKPTSSTTSLRNRSIRKVSRKFTTQPCGLSRKSALNFSIPKR